MKSVVCNICNSKDISILYSSATALSITSDLRIWPKGIEVLSCQTCGHVFKNARKIAVELKKIYTSYQLFQDNEVRDQAIFIKNAPPKSRSQILVESLPSLTRLPKRGNFLDIGCNKGLLIREFGIINPDWALYGYEISKDYEPFIEKVKNFKKFYWGDVNKIHEQFDLVTLIHTLEHTRNPVKFLKDIRKLLIQDGLLLIQVPNFRQNPFDILIYEHISHFYPETLEALLIKSGFEVALKSELLIPKELTFICKVKRAGFNGQVDFGSFLKKYTRKNIKFLNQFSKLVMKLKGEKSLVVFGTAEVGTWVAGILDSKFDFFVDESPWRVGKKHLGIPIKYPKVLKKENNVILGMAPMLARRVYTKWKHTKAKFLYPFRMT